MHVLVSPCQIRYVSLISRDLNTHVMVDYVYCNLMELLTMSGLGRIICSNADCILNAS